MERRAFTLIELLVVIAIIAVLAALLLPALSAAKAKAHQVGCLRNLKQLQLSWQLYCDDHGEGLPPTTPVLPNLQARETLTATPNSWIIGNAWADDTTTHLQQSLSYAYLRGPMVYRCPADRSTVRDQGRIPRTRSYSISWHMGMWPDPSAEYHGIAWHRLHEIRSPGPSQAFVVADEHENSIQQTVFALNHRDYFVWSGTRVWTWISFTATRHGDAGTLSCADGHTETWRWREPNTLDISRRKTWHLQAPPLAVAQTDRDLKRFFAALPEKVPIP